MYVYTLYISTLQVLREVDCLLFSLLILNGLSDSRGHMWRSQSSQLYLVEVTLPENTVRTPDSVCVLTILLHIHRPMVKVSRPSTCSDYCPLYSASAPELWNGRSN